MFISLYHYNNSIKNSMILLKLVGFIVLLSVWINVVVAKKKISLTFVFDSTGSMGDDLAQVKTGTTQIVQKFESMGNKSPIEEYVLVTFNDPNIGTPFITKDVDKFKRSLSLFSVTGGGDCAEMCMGGIEKAAQVSRNGSTIYVFTDASAKDYYMYPSVLSLLQEKDLKVDFVLTGDCGKPNSTNFQIYYHVANNTGGQVFYIQKDNVKEFMKKLLDGIGSDEIDVDSSPSSYCNNRTYWFQIKRYTASVTLDAITNDPTESITGYLYDPRGNSQNSWNGLIVNFAGQRNIYSVTKRNPMPGRWTVLITSSTCQFNLKIKTVANEMPERTTMRHYPKRTTKKYKPNKTTKKYKPNKTTKKQKSKTTSMDGDAYKKWLFKLNMEYRRTHSGSSQLQGTFGFMAVVLFVAIANLF